jgi:hypothetical protein
MTAYEYIIFIRDTLGSLPYNVGGAKHKGIASNSDVRRILQNKGISINGSRPDWKDTIFFPINSLIFFPNGNRVTFL